MHWFHTWTKWRTEVVSYGKYDGIIEHRECTVCGKRQIHRIA